MSAREKLIRFVTAIVGRVPEAPRDPETGRPVADLHRYVDHLLAEHAHELAEKIRVGCGELVDAAGPRTTPSDPKYDRAAGFADAANMIDPEVSSDGS